MPKLIYELLPAMRRERGWSVSVLSRMTVQPGDPGIGEKTIEAIERNPGRVPEARIIEALTRAFEVDPESFYEYPIALARQTAKASDGAVREAREREAAALRERAQQRHARREDEPGTKPAPPRRRRRAG